MNFDHNNNIKNNNDNNSNNHSIDIYRYLIGNWKRCLEFRQFGGLFQHLFTTNTIVTIEEFNRLHETTANNNNNNSNNTNNNSNNNNDSNVRYLRWKFGKTGNGYEMAVRPSAGGHKNSSTSSHRGNNNNNNSGSSAVGGGGIGGGSLLSASAASLDRYSAQKQTKFEWQVAGTTCEGYYYHESKVAIFNFILSVSIVTVTYRIMDENTMAVSIVEMDDKYQPTIQYGNMYRL